MSSGVVALYEQSLARRGFVSDPAQWRAVQRLQRLFAKWGAYKTRRSSTLRVTSNYHPDQLERIFGALKDVEEEKQALDVEGRKIPYRRCGPALHLAGGCALR